MNLPIGSAKVKKLKPTVPVLIFCATEDNITITKYAVEFKKRNRVSIVEFKGEHLTGINTLAKDSTEETGSAGLVIMPSSFHRN